MALETLNIERDRLEKEEKKKAGIPEEPEDTLTVKQILNDKEKSDLLGDMVKHGGDPADEQLMTRLVSGKIEAADFDRLEELRGGLSEKIRDAENIKSELTPELAMDIAKGNPDLEKIVKSVSPEGVVKAVHETIKNIAVNDPDNFAKILKRIETVKSYKDGDFKKLDESVNEICKGRGFNADEFLKKGAIKDFDERQKALGDLVKAGWGKQGGLGVIKKVGNFFTGDLFSTMKATTLEGKRQEVSDALAELDKRKKKLGAVLVSSISGNKDDRSTNREMVGTPKKKEIVGMNDVKKEPPTKESLQQDFKKYIKNIANWNTLDEAGKDSWRDKS